MEERALTAAAEERLRASGLNTDGCFFVSVCFGIRPDYAKELRAADYTEWSVLNLRVYGDVEQSFRGRSLGVEISRGIYDTHILCVLPVEFRADYCERFIRPELDRLEAQYRVPLLAGVGYPVEDDTRLREAVESARYAHGLYFFNQSPLIDLRQQTKGARMILDEYKVSLETAVRAILIKDERALEKIDRVVEIISRFHYGNRNGVQILTMEFAGELAFRLRLPQMLGDEFFRMQDELQFRVVRAESFPELAGVVHDYYARVLRLYYQNDRPRGKLVIEEVKDYIRAHFMEDLSIKKLAAIAYVSPDYFSHLFRNATGKNYKAFLTEIRMEHAVELLRETDGHVSEIGEKVGYNSTRAFVDAFKQTYSVSPLEYRRRVRSEEK